MVHLYLSWKYIPGREGILAGIINIGVGLGGVTFTALSNVLANPNTVDSNKDINEKPFSPSVAQNVPFMLRTLLFIFAGLFVIAFFTIQGYPGRDTLQVKKEELEVKERRYTMVEDQPVSERSLTADDAVIRNSAKSFKEVASAFKKQNTLTEEVDDLNFKKQITTRIGDENSQYKR